MPHGSSHTNDPPPPTTTTAFLRGGRSRRRRRLEGPSENSSPLDLTTSGVAPTAEMTAGSAGGLFRLSTPTATLPPSEEGSLDLPVVPEDEASEQPFHNIALTSPPLAGGTATKPSSPCSHARASPQSLSPSWGLRGHHAPSPPQNARSSPRPSPRFFANYVLARGADTRGLFRLSEEGSSDIVASSGGGNVWSRLTSGTTPSSGGSDNRRRRRVAPWRGSKRGVRAGANVSSNTSSAASTSTAPGRRTMLGIESAFSLSPSLSLSASSSTKSGSAVRSPASV